MSFILGKNVILYILTSASPVEYTVIGCARNTKITLNVETADKTTIGSGTFREYKPLSSSWTGSVDGLSADQNISIRNLLAYAEDLTILTIQFDLGDGGNPLTGEILLTNVEAGANYNDAATFNVTFQGTGQLNLS